MKNIKHIIRQSISAVLISTMVLITVGCGNSTEKETELQTEAQTVLKEEIKVTITDDNGNKITLEGETKIDDNGKTVIEATDSAGNKVTLDADIKTDDKGNTVVDNVQIRDKENATLITDDNKPAEITKPIESISAETETKVEVVTKPVETQPVTVKPTEPATQAPTTKPTQPATQPTTAATQPATQAPTNSLVQAPVDYTHSGTKAQINSEAGQQKLRDAIIKWINILREEEQPGCPKLTQNYDLNKVYQDRAVSIASNFKHDNYEELFFCNKYNVGHYQVDPNIDSTFGQLFNRPYYYSSYLQEAITKVGYLSTFCGNTFDETVENIAKTVATSYRNSPGHWSYVGKKTEAEISVGIYTDGIYIYNATAVGKDF